MVVFRYLAYGGVKISNGEKIELTKKESYFWEILLLFISSSNSEGIELRQREILSKEWSIFKYIDDQDKLFDYALQEGLIAECSYMEDSGRAFAITSKGKDEVAKLLKSLE